MLSGRCRRLHPFFVAAFLFPFALAQGQIMDATSTAVESQLTSELRSHVLTNLNVWSPDGTRIVFDVRPGEDFTGKEIAEVDVKTRSIRSLYVSGNGADCGVVTYSPVVPRVAFILGPEHPTADWQYGTSRRQGVLVDTQQPGRFVPIDAMNYAPPFVPGALRGGSHVHIFSPRGDWISFTYEDEVLARLPAGGAPHDLNQRNVGVSVPGHPIHPHSAHPRNHDGTYFSVIVTQTTPAPRPGSDDIARAFEEGWIGRDGYVRPDGTRQERALAFQGLITTTDGRQHAEVFVVDLPADLTRAGDRHRPLEGTATRYPGPPSGTRQRRLTFTSDRKFPGVAAVPRHWLRASPDGSQIAFLMADDAGVVQLWTVSPNGGAPRQITRESNSVASTISWSPDGQWIAHIRDHSVCISEVSTGKTWRLTSRSAEADAPSALACVFAPQGDRIAYVRSVGEATRRFPQIFVVTVPAELRSHR